MITKEKQSTYINVRLTESDAKELQKRAEQEMLSVSAYVRRKSLLTIKD